MPYAASPPDRLQPMRGIGPVREWTHRHPDLAELALGVAVAAGLMLVSLWQWGLTDVGWSRGLTLGLPFAVATVWVYRRRRLRDEIASGRCWSNGFDWRASFTMPSPARWPWSGSGRGSPTSASDAAGRSRGSARAHRDRQPNRGRRPAADAGDLARGPDSATRRSPVSHSSTTCRTSCIGQASRSA